MPFTTQESVSRGDRIGPSRLDQWRSNDAFLRAMFAREHDPSTGLHNCRTVPRVFATIVGTTVSPSTARITSVTNPAAGKMSIFLQSGQFTVGMRPVVCLNDHNGKPHLARCDVISATQLDIYGSSLSSALGAGNTWTTFDMTKGLSIAIYDEPVTPGGFLTAPPSESASSGFLSDSEWNVFPPSSAELAVLSSLGHSLTDGSHAIPEVALAHAYAFWTGAIHSATEFSGVSAITNVLPGFVTITMSPALPSVSGHIVLPNPGDGRLVTAHCWGSSTTAAAVSMYAYNPTAKTWAAADFDFFVLLHG